MFDRRTTIAALALLTALTGTLGAQTVNELLTLKAKNDSALAALDLVRPAPVAPVVPPPEVFDTLNVGSVTLVTAHAAIPVLRSAINGGSVSVIHAYGDAGRRALAQTIVTGHLRIPPANASGVPPAGTLNIHLQVGANEADLPREVCPCDSLEATTDVSLGISRAIRAALDSTLRVWMPVLRPPGADSAQFGERAFRIAVSSGSAAVRRCLAGDDNACKSALGLIPTDDPVHAWYDPVDYPDMVKLASVVHAQLETDFGIPVVRACLNDRDIRSCTRIVGDIPRTALRPPMPDDVRSLLFLVAMTHGGDGAFDRLVRDSTAAPLERLAAAANMPEHDLLVAWRKRVTMLRPTRALPTAGITLVALVWIGCCFGLALRGTPWN
jgi:hypothetical protein